MSAATQTLLAAQLEDALSELVAGDGDLREVAALAGQLQRLDASHPVLQAEPTDP